MGAIICFISEEMADFEITLAFHKIHSIGKMEVLTAGYDLNSITSESGLLYKPHITLTEAMELKDAEGLIIPGGPIKPQKKELTDLICSFHSHGKLLAAICNGSQYLGRAGILNSHKFTTSCTRENLVRIGQTDPFPWDNYVNERVVRDGNVITAKGRAFVDFSFALFDFLKIYKDSNERDCLLKDILNL